MQFITVREFRSSTAQMWRKLRKEKQLVVTSRGKPVAVVVDTDEKRVGDTLLDVRRRAAMEALNSIHEDAERCGLSSMSMRQIDAIIAESRRERRAKREKGQ
jgi:prevent-host-death family protein